MVHKIEKQLNIKRPHGILYDVGNPGPALGHAEKYGGVKHVNGIPILLITGSPSAIQI
jgi:hypothetical protein